MASFVALLVGRVFAVDQDAQTPWRSGAYVWKPAVTRTIEEQVVVTPASTRYETIPAEYKTVERQVQVRPRSTRRVSTPAEYKTVEEQVQVRPGYFRGSEWVPPEYETRRKRVMVKPAGERVVEIPAEYRTVTEQVMTRPATTRQVPIPAEYKTVTREVREPERWDYETGAGRLAREAFDVSECAGDVRLLEAVRATFVDQLTRNFEAPKLLSGRDDSSSSSDALKFGRTNAQSAVITGNEQPAAYFERSSYELFIYQSQSYLWVNIRRDTKLARRKDGAYLELPSTQQRDAYDNEVKRAVEAAIADTAAIHNAVPTNTGIVKIMPATDTRDTR